MHELTPEQLAEKYRAIADEIEAYPERWCQGQYRRTTWDGQVSLCAIGFMDDHGVGLGLSANPVYAAVKEIAHRDMSIATYNDAPGRTPTDIVALFRLAAELAEQAYRLERATTYGALR